MVNNIYDVVCARAVDELLRNLDDFISMVVTYTINDHAMVFYTLYTATMFSDMCELSCSMDVQVL